MGTTATTNLALIKPDDNESIKPNLPTFAGWAQQNSDNCDKIDALFRASQLTWTPTWQGSGGNPVLGTGGFVEGKYIRLMPRMVLGFFRIFAGTTGFSAGSGGYTIPVPVAPAAELTTFAGEVTVGAAAFLDASAVATCAAFKVCYSTGGGGLFFRQSINDVWTSSSPVAPAQSDRLSGYFMYPTSVA